MTEHQKRMQHIKETDPILYYELTSDPTGVSGNAGCGTVCWLMKRDFSTTNKYYMKTEFDETTKSSNEARLLLADGVLENAIELLPASTYEPNYIGYFVKQDDEDMGNEDFCEACIDDAVLDAKNNNKSRRNEILDKYKQIEETGFYNGKDCKHYPKELIESSKKSELKEYPKKSKFTYEGHDPDFGGGESEPKSCEDCGHYFHTNFEPDEDCANRLLEDLNDGDLLKDDYKESLKWKLEIAFGNYDYCDLEVKEILVKCAEIVIKTYSSDNIS